MFINFKNIGIECVEFSYRYIDYIETVRFAEKAGHYAEMAAETGIGLWSVHLPFGNELDISTLNDYDRALTVSVHKKLIRAAGEAGMKTVVLHPSAEPINENKRAERLKRSRENILALAECCDKYALNLAVENLPRTCLCNASGEMLELLAGTGATACFDVNHPLMEDAVLFINSIFCGGLAVSTLHISDYDFVNERHWLPGEGVIDWPKTVNALEKNNYNGPLMYEISFQHKNGNRVTLDEMAENQRWLAHINQNDNRNR